MRPGGHLRQSSSLAQTALLKRLSIMPLGEDTTLNAGLSYSDDTQRKLRHISWRLRGEHKLSDDSKLYAFGQVGLTGDNTRTTDRIGAGAEVRLSKTLFGGGEISTGEDGSWRDGLACAAKKRMATNITSLMISRFGLSQPSNFGTLNVGTDASVTATRSPSFGEERLQFNDRGLNGSDPCIWRRLERRVTGTSVSSA